MMSALALSPLADAVAASLLPLAVLTVFFLLLGARFFLSRVGELVDEL